MTAHAKFRMGELLHNHTTNEDGLVTRVYEVGGGRLHTKLQCPLSAILGQAATMFRIGLRVC
jgi:hypothetical protein